ncbi:hypothetical protein TEA_026663 [Camellia sinensis var. sinensis]|uniref:Uncharacterized protein n=1 Tax=Camellia sinensis var. sinensis TaxID=542762 RepID=A0A4S4F0J2_CAMSN|nr:hypothetical protein TEA_026663 [Camellia sinensis var. sinensis]
MALPMRRDLENPLSPPSSSSISSSATPPTPLIFHIGIVRATSLGFFAIDKQCDHHRGKGGLQLAKSDIFIIFIYKGWLNLRMLFVRSVLASYGSGAVGGGGFGVNSSWSNEFSLKEKTKTKRA